MGGPLVACGDGMPLLDPDPAALDPVVVVEIEANKDVSS